MQSKKDIEKIEGVYIRSGKKPGKTVAIFGGVHGNEKVGVKMIDILRKKLKVIAGTVYLVYGNPEAIKQNKRFIEKNLNRCFLKNNDGKTQEDIRARELMKILDQCDALLDLHSFTNPGGERFVLCEKDGFGVAKKIDTPTISFGWNSVEAGNAGDYMHKNKKMALGMECGPHHKIEESLGYAKFAVDIFLKYFKSISGKMIIDNKPKKYVQVTKAIIRKSKDFKFIKDYKNFDSLKEGEIFAVEDWKKYIAKKNECIILPTPNEPIGGEICLLGKEKYVL